MSDGSAKKTAVEQTNVEREMIAVAVAMKMMTLGCLWINMMQAGARDYSKVFAQDA